jgi:dihydroxy-acid dehydratase
MEMATAMTMAVAGEALGIAMPDNASIPATDSRRSVLAERAGRRAVALADEDVRPRDIMTPEAFQNAIRVIMAIGGSTNSIVHLLAIAGRLGVDLSLDDFAAERDIPLLANLRPSGDHLLDRFFYAGGVQALMGEMADLLHGSLMTVNGKTVDENRAGRHSLDDDVIRPLSDPVSPESAIAVLQGNLAPGGAVLKRCAADPKLFQHRGPAFVFEDVRDLAARLDDEDLPITAEHVIVLKGGGPIGAPGMPEWGHIPIPGKLVAQESRTCCGSPTQGFLAGPRRYGRARRSRGGRRRTDSRGRDRRHHLRGCRARRAAPRGQRGGDRAAPGRPAGAAPALPPGLRGDLSRPSGAGRPRV